MSTKTLFVLTVVLLFLAGLGFGMGLTDLLGWGKIVPKDVREQVLANAAQQAERDPANPAADFRTQANLLASAYASAVAEGGRVVARGGQVSQASSLTTQRSAALASWFRKTIGTNNQQTFNALLEDEAQAFFAYAQQAQAVNPADKNAAVVALGAKNKALAEFLAAVDPTHRIADFQPLVDQFATAIRSAIDAGARNDAGQYLNQSLTGSAALGRAMDRLIIDLAAVPTTRF